MMKKMLSIILALSFLFSGLASITALAAAGPASPSDWAVEEVEKGKYYNLVTTRVLSNYQQNITREEFCELAIKLYEVLSGKKASPGQSRFADTNNTEVLKAYDLGIVKGINTEETLFAPERSISRQEIAVMFHRTLKSVDLSYIAGEYLLNFADKNQIASWAAEAVGLMNGKGIIKGNEKNEVNPLGNTTREQAIAIVTRTYESFYMSGGSGTQENFEGFSTESEEKPKTSIEPMVINATSTADGFKQKVNPKDGPVKVVSQDISVTVPYTSLPIEKELTVDKIKNIPPKDGVRFVSAFDIKLEDIKEFSSLLKIEIPLPDSGHYGAFYYNPDTKQWENILYEQKSKNLIIKTNHLSTYGVAEIDYEKNKGAAAKIDFYYIDFYNFQKIDVNKISGLSRADLERIALEKGWEAAKDWFEIGTVSTNIINKTLPGFSTINDVVTKMGKALIPMQLYFDISNGKHKDAAAGAYEAALSLIIEKLGSAGANIGFLGASLINMSIKEFATAAISSKESQYEKAYNYYYNINNSLNRGIKIRNGKDWYEAFYKIVETDPQNINERINTEIANYANAIWNDIELLTAQGIIGQEGQSSSILGGGAYLNDELKQRLSNNYISLMSGYFNTILEEAIDDYDWDERKKFQREYSKKVKDELNKEYSVKVKVNGNNKDNIKVQFKDPAYTGWEGYTNSNGEWIMDFTMLGYLRAGAPKKISMWDKEGKETIKDFNIDMESMVFGENSSFEEEENKNEAAMIQNDLELIYPSSVTAGEMLEIKIERNGNDYSNVEITSNNPVLKSKSGTHSRKLHVPAKGGTYEISAKDNETGQKKVFNINVVESEIVTKAIKDISNYKLFDDLEPLNFKNLTVKTYYGGNRSNTPSGELEPVVMEFLSVDENGVKTTLRCEIAYVVLNNEKLALSRINGLNLNGEPHGRHYQFYSEREVRGKTNPLSRMYIYENGKQMKFVDFRIYDPIISPGPVVDPSPRYGEVDRFEAYEYDSNGVKKVIKKGAWVAEAIDPDDILKGYRTYWTGDTYED